MNFQKGMKLDHICMKMKLMKNIFAANFFLKGICMGNYNRFYV